MAVPLILPYRINHNFFSGFHLPFAAFAASIKSFSANPVSTPTLHSISFTPISSWCFDEEFGIAVYAVVVIRPKGCFRGKLDDHISFMGWFMGLVLDVPAEGIEERIQEVDPYLGLGIALPEIVVLVLVELPDQGLDILFERLEISH
jgi:hypothetical protein